MDMHMVDMYNFVSGIFQKSALLSVELCGSRLCGPVDQFSWPIM